MKNLQLIFLCLICNSLFAQILYVPSGTSGIDVSLVTGNIGIGTSAPDSKLDINQAGGGTGQNNAIRLRAGNTLSYYGNNQALFSFSGTSNYSHAIKTRHNADNIQGNSFDFYVWKPGDAVGSVGSGHVMSLNGGKVGIQTTSPAALLDVAGFINNGQLGTVLGRLAEGNTSGSGTFLGVRGYATQQDEYSGKSFAIEHSFYGIVNSSVNFYRGGGTTGGFITFNTSSNSEKMRILSNGNVGIGTTVPNHKLTVLGTIYSQEVRVDLSVPGPDYVFEEDYDLPSLSEVASYIRQNKHLPEVPAATEMEKNGIDLGAMNMLLLKKVEELTLYMIQQQNLIDAQNKRIADLEEQIKK